MTNSVRWAANVVLALAIALAIALAGCSTLPSSGPAGYDVTAAQPQADSPRYALIKITPAVVDILGRNEPRFSAVFSDQRPPSRIVFGIGDVVSVTIFEAAAGGLFIPAEASVRPGNFVTLPNQSVDSNGNISVPYAGLIRARGRTQPQVQQAIVDALKTRALEPQAVVALVDQRTSLISILGDVNAPSRIPASAAGERVVDAIARAGGPKSQGFDSWVMLDRNGKREIIPFGALLYERSNNIYVRPNDTIFLYREPQTFVAFGAFVAGTATQAQFGFDAWRLTLAEAIAKAGGLNDSQADPASVFLYRGETRRVAEQLGVDVATFDGPIIPIVYNLNVRDPAAYFLTTRFQMRKHDVLFASNAQAVETSKLLNYLRLITATINDPIVAATNGFALRAAAGGARSAIFSQSPPLTSTTAAP